MTEDDISSPWQLFGLLALLSNPILKGFDEDISEKQDLPWQTPSENTCNNDSIN